MRQWILQDNSFSISHRQPPQNHASLASGTLQSKTSPPRRTVLCAEPEGPGQSHSRSVSGRNKAERNCDRQSGVSLLTSTAWRAAGRRGPCLPRLRHRFFHSRRKKDLHCQPRIPTGFYRRGRGERTKTHQAILEGSTRDKDFMDSPHRSNIFHCGSSLG